MEKRLSQSGKIIFIVLLTIVGQAAIDLYLPSLPAMTKYFNIDKVWIQWTISIYLLGYGFSQIIYGPLSDYFGRRIILLTGLFLCILSSLGCAFSFSAIMLLVFRLIQGFGNGAASVTARAIMRDSFEGKELFKASSYMAMAWALVPILAPVVGGYLQSYIGWQANFIFLTIFCIGIYIFSIIKLPETCKTLKTGELSLQNAAKNYFCLFKNFAFVSNMICLILLFSVFVIFNVASPFLFQSLLGLSPVQYSLILLISSLGYLIGSFSNSKLVRNYSSQKITLVGMFILVISSTIMLVLTKLGYMHVATIVVPMFVNLFGLGLIFANCLSSCLQPFPHIAGSASAMYGFLVFAGSSITSAIFSKYSAIDASPFTFTIFGLSIAMLSVFGFIIGKSSKSDK